MDRTKVENPPKPRAYAMQLSIDVFVFVYPTVSQADVELQRVVPATWHIRFIIPLLVLHVH